MQSDGNLVLYQGSRVCWASGTENTPGAYAYLVIPPWHDPYTNYLVVRDGYNNEIRRYLAGTKNGSNVNVNNNGEVWITAKKFVSC